MKKTSTLLSLLFSLGAFLISTAANAQYEIQSIYLQNPDNIVPHLLRSADFWKASVDWEDGGFYQEVNRDGTPERTDRKSFTQCSRHAYGFSRAFMVSGEEEYLDYAEHALQFVYDYGWDYDNGGWYFSSDKMGNPAPPYGGGWNPNTTKWSFSQHYSILGIGALAEATRAPLHLDWLEESAYFNDSLLWDSRPAYQGFYNTAGEDWSNPNGKGFTATVDAITTWVLAKALVTGAPEDEERLLAVADNIIDYLYESMFLPQVQFGFAEGYNSNWGLNAGSQGGSTGHVIKTAWCLARAYMIEPKHEYLVAAQYMIDDMMYNGGYDYNNGGLYANYNWGTGIVEQTKNHWMLEQGITGGLINYFLATDPVDRELNLGMADQCLGFYMEHFIDEEYGECYMATNALGGVTNADKSDAFKGGYHNIELSYLTYVYGKLFVHDEPLPLYYRFEESAEERQFKMTPLAIVGDILAISEVELNGEAYANYDGDSRVLTIPAGVGGIFKVTYFLDGELVSAEELESRPSVQVFPNPAREYFFLADIPDGATVSVFNMEGRMVKAYQGVLSGQPLSIADLPKGMYVVNVRAGGEVQQQKLIRQ